MHPGSSEGITKQTKMHVDTVAASAAITLGAVALAGCIARALRRRCWPAPQDPEERLWGAIDL